MLFLCILKVNIYGTAASERLALLYNTYSRTRFKTSNVDVSTYNPAQLHSTSTWARWGGELGYDSTEDFSPLSCQQRAHFDQVLAAVVVRAA